MTASSYASDAKITEALAVLGADLIGQTEQTLLQQLVVAAALGGGGGGGGAATWGTITGTLSAQADLQAALDAKADLAGANTFTDHNVFAASVSLRNGTTPQTLEVYNTYTDGSNYERGVFEFDSNVLRIGTEKAGTGSARAIDFVVGGAARWGISTAGHLLASTDSTYDIGANGANRPRNIYIGNDFRATGSIFAAGGYIQTASGASLGFLFNDNAFIASPSAGVIKLENWFGSDFGRLQFGGTTSSYPAIKRTGSDVEIVKADGTAADTAIILSSPDGTRYRVSVSNAGVLTTTAV